MEALRALARRLVADQDGAADLVQETCASALAAPPPPLPSRRWLVTILRNAFRQQARCRGRRRRREADYAVVRDVTNAGTSPAEDLEWHRYLVETIATLAPELRDVVILHYWRGLSIVEISTAVQLPRSTVGGRLERAIDTLRQRLVTRSPHGWRRGLLALAAARRPAAAGALFAGLGVFVMKSHVVWIVAGLLTLALGVGLWMSSPGPADLGAPRMDGPVARALASEATEVSDVAIRSAATLPSTPAPAPVAGSQHLRGFVLGVDGAGIGGLTIVFAAGQTPASSASADVVATSAAGGAFTLLPPQVNGWLSVRSTQWATVRREWLTNGAAEHEPTLLVAPARDYAGVVVDPHDQPVAGARVVGKRPTAA